MDRGFTLIELLIVVAIIAVLAAIAVPNFLEAHSRSKVTRARADMRTLNGALEAYRVDNNGYPVPTGNGIPSRLWRLSSPISYLSRPRLADPFGTKVAGATVRHELEYWGGNDRRTALSSSADGTLLPNNLGGGEARVIWYFLRSAGPDEDVNAQGAGFQTWMSPALLSAYLYDPTNGTVSFGDIFRVGGAVADPFRAAAELASQAHGR